MNIDELDPRTNPNEPARRYCALVYMTEAGEKLEPWHTREIPAAEAIATEMGWPHYTDTAGFYAYLEALRDDVPACPYEDLSDGAICGEPVKLRGWCAHHYERSMKWDDPYMADGIRIIKRARGHSPEPEQD